MLEGAINHRKIGLKIGLIYKKKASHNREKPLFMLVRLTGFEPVHPVPETGALSPEL